MKRTIAFVSLLAVMTGFTPTVSANGISYDQVSISYVSLESDGFEPSGFGFSGMRSITDNVFVGANYTSVSEEIEFCFFECSDISLTMNELHLGLGYRLPINKTTDAYALVSYVNLGVDVAFEGESESDSENGHAIQIGLRFMLTEQLEVDGGFSSVSVNDESQTGFGVGLYYYINSQLSLGASYSSADDVNGYQAKVRFNF